MSSAAQLPTNAEIEILAVLWQHNWSSVREVFTRLAAHRDTGYTTTLKLLQIMHAKGIVQRDESRRTHLYNAIEPSQVTQRKLIADLAKRAFNGSTLDLLRTALQDPGFPPDDLIQVQASLDTLRNPPPPNEGSTNSP